MSLFQSERSEKQTSMARSEEEDFLFARQLGEVSVLPMVMKVAIELNVFEIMAKAGPGAQISPKTIVAELPTKNPNAVEMIDRILRALTSYSVLNSSLVTSDEGVVERLYGLESVCKYFVPDEDGVSMAANLLLMQDKVFVNSWDYMKDAILEGGIPFNKAHGMHAFEYPETDLRFNDVFNKAMFSISTIMIKKMLEMYNGFEGLKELVDVGGGDGITIGLITSKYPAIKGINFDLPHVIEHAPSFPGVEHVAGDMFDSVPKGEAIFMKWIIHDWSDECCLTLLRNCYKALPENGKLILVEGVMPVAAENDIAAKTLCHDDLVMMSQNPGGKERTEEQLFNLVRGAGFASMKMVCCVFSLWVIEIHKR